MANPAHGRAPGSRRHGIRIELAPGNPMALPHLLDKDWAAYRWFGDRAARDHALHALESGSPYFRQGDQPAVLYTAIDE